MTPTADQARVWHELFTHAPLSVLDRALACGMVPGPCAVDGQDLLATLLARPAPELTGRGELGWWSHAYPGPAPAPASLSAAVQSLLEQGANPFGLVPGQPHAPVSVLDVALAKNLPAAVLAVCKWARDHGQGHQVDACLQAPPVGGPSLPLLHACASLDRREMAQALLDLGLDPNACDARGRPVLFLAQHEAMAHILLERGARADLPAADGTTLAEKWMEGSRRCQAGGQWTRMLALIQTQAPGTEQAVAVTWWAQADLTAANHASMGIQEVRTRLAQALAQAPAHAWRARVLSGPLRGQASLLSQLAWRWLHDVRADACHLALLEKPQQVLGPAPMPIRRGLEDWGVFCLGAARHLAMKLDQLGSPTAQQAAEQNQKTAERLRQSRHHTRQLLEAMGPLAQREARMIQAAATLGRPVSTTWLDVSRAWTHHLAQHHDPGMDKPIPTPEQALACQHALSLAARAAAAGVRWLGHKPALEQVQRWHALYESEAGMPPVSRQDLLEVCICMLADSMQVNESQVFPSKAWTDRKAVVSLVETAVFLVDEPAGGIVRPFGPVVESKLQAIASQLAPGVATRLLAQARHQGLSGHLPAPQPAVARPRL